MKKKLSFINLALASVIVMAGCQSPGGVRLGDKNYQPDTDGAVVLTEEEFETLTKDKKVKFIEGQVPNVKLSEAEYQVVQDNDEAFFSLVGEANSDDAVAALIRPGSLKKNLERIVSENGWSALYFDGPDYFIEKPGIMEEVNVSGAVMSLSSDYPVYTCFDEAEKVVTVIRDE